MAAIRITLAAALAAMTCAAEARVTKLEITTKESPAYNGASFGDAGQYERLIGTLTGEVDPNDRRNAIIQDLQLAPRNARGMVEYKTTFLLVKPIDMSKSSRILFQQVPNRGGRIDIGNRARTDTGLSSAWRGDVGLSSGWQGDMTGAQVERVTVPVAKNADGSSITGPYTVTLADLGSGSPISADGSTATIYAGLNNPTIPYPPASTDTSQGQLTSYGSYSFNTGRLGSDERVVAAADWAFGDCTSTAFPGTPSTTKICVRGGFDKSRIYRLVYRVKDPLVLGLGLAAFRDAAAFFRYAAADDSGTPNPLAGQLRWTIVQGTSQSGNFIKTMIHLGFTEDDAAVGRRVWDGAIPFIAARQNPINYRFAISGGEGKLYEQGSDPVLWWDPYTDTARGRVRAGMLDRCRASGTCPKITEVNGSAEYWNLRMSPGIIGTNADTDIPVPAEVRRYYVPSTTHGGGNGQFTLTPAATASTVGTCVLPANPMPESTILRALTKATIDWVTAGVEMPPSAYPKVGDGTLVAESRLNFPAIPGAPNPRGTVNTVIDYDYGTNFVYNDMSGYITTAPIIVKKLIPTYIPQVDPDGNELAGVKPLMGYLPLGTYTGWNITANGFYKGQACAFSGGFIPFAKTRAERLAAGDPRLSIEERYPNFSYFFWMAKWTVERLVDQRLLLSDDAPAELANAVTQVFANGVFAKDARADSVLRGLAE